MERPLIVIGESVTIKDVFFPKKKIHISNDHTEGYWLIFRKTVWNLDHKFEFTITLSDGRRFHVTIKGGFKTDLASTPKACHVIYPPFDERYGAGALGHDGFYGAEIFPRWFNDLFLKKAMEVCMATEFDQFCFYNAVKDWGWITYRSHTDKSVEQNRKHIVIEELPCLA